MNLGLLAICLPLASYVTTSLAGNASTARTAPTVSVLTPGAPVNLSYLSTFETEFLSLGTSSAFDRRNNRAMQERAMHDNFDPVAILSHHLLAALHENGIAAVETPFKRDSRSGAESISRADWPTDWPTTIERVLDASISVMGLRSKSRREPVILVRWRVRDQEGRPQQRVQLVSYNARGADIQLASVFSPVDIPPAPTELEPTEPCRVPSLQDSAKNGPQSWQCFDTALAVIADAIARDPIWRAPVSHDSF
jgi:hypothetical protein